MGNGLQLPPTCAILPSNQHILIGRMAMDKPTVVDYRRLRPGNLNTPEFSHVKLLLYWPLFGLVFFLLEDIWIRDSYRAVYCPLDDCIPFCELFVIPYFAWFLFLIGAHVYTLLYNVPAFRRLMGYIMVTYTVSTLIFILFPSCQTFRPQVFPRDNFLTEIVEWLYDFDTNTNVCPSLHVVGSVAAMLAFWDCERFSAKGRRFGLGLVAFVISVSTVFLRQHSVIDLLVAVPVCILGYVLVYRKEIRTNNVAPQV